MNNSHLTHEQMESLLSDSQLKEESLHLKSCTQCSTEVDSLLSVLDDLRTCATASAEHHRRVAVMPVLFHPMLRAVCAVLAVGVLIGIAVPLALHQKQSRTTTTITSQKVTSATITDEQLWNSVQEDLSSSIPEPMLPLATTNVSTVQAVPTDNTKEN